jgi:hypothetical protein
MRRSGPVGAEVVARTRAASESYGREERGASDRLADTQIRVSYRGTPWVRDDAPGLEEKVPAAGDRAPDAGGLVRHGIGFPQHLFEILRGTGHVLLGYFAGADAAKELADFAALGEKLRAFPLRNVAVTADPLPDQPRVGVLHDREHAFAAAYGASEASFLVRPDGHIGWRGRSPHDPGLRAHLARLFDATAPRRSDRTGGTAAQGRNASMALTNPSSGF